MIRVTIQLESAISSTRDAHLGTLIIANDGTSKNLARGNYQVMMFGKTGRHPIRRARVENHARNAHPVGTLIRKALEALNY